MFGFIDNSLLWGYFGATVDFATDVLTDVLGNC